MAIGTEEPKAVLRLTKDLRDAAASMTVHEARFLVDSYYTMQENRKRSANQIRAMGESGEPCEVLEWLMENSRILEGRIKAALDKFSMGSALGGAARNVLGIGPVIAAGLLSHIDIEKARYPSSIWRFAGLDPTQVWKKGQKRPWNAQLKTLCWKAGDSFVKLGGKGFYGAWYREVKESLVERNEAGEFAPAAAEVLANRPKHAQAAIYTEGRLPDGHVDMRARRQTVKMFLAHYWEVGKRLAGEAPPKPYAISVLGHGHYVPPPEEWGM